MREYPKIETLLDRDEHFKVMPGKWRLPELDFLQANQWLFTEKIDGTNVRIGWNGQAFTYGGHTEKAQMPLFLLRRLQELLPASLMLDSFPSATDVTLYGEGYGAKIRKRGDNYKSDGVDFVLFDVLVDAWWLTRENVEDVARKLGIRCVPIVGQGTLQEALALAQKGFASQWGAFPAEGLVVRPLVDLWTRKGQRIIGKIKTRDFG